MAAVRSGRAPRPERVYVNVYDLTGANEALYQIGLGTYHSGIEVHGTEYTFAGGAGVFSHLPQQAQGAVFRERVPGPAAAPRANGARVSLQLPPRGICRS